MEDYRIRDGIVLEEICGRFLLISTKAIREKCRYVRAVEPIVAYYWDMMERGMSVDEMAETASKQFQHVSQETLRNDILDLITDLKEAGCLLADDEL